MRLKKMTLRAVYSNIAPFVKLNTTNGEITGLMPDMFRQLTNWMRLNFTLIKEPYDDYGKHINGTFTGMLGMLYRNEVDVILNPHPMKEYMVGYATCSNAIHYGSYSFLSGKEAEHEGFFLYFTVLNKAVWVLMLVSMTTMTLLSALSSSHLLPYKQNFHKIVYQYFWNLILYLFKQGPNEKWLLRTNTKKKSLTIPLVTTLWLFGVSFFIMTAFQSLLVAKLSVRKLKPIVDSMEDFLKKDIPGYGVEGMYLQQQLRNSQIETNKKVWDKIKDHMLGPKKILSEKNLLKVQQGKLCILWGPEILARKLLDHYKAKKSNCLMHLSLGYIFNFPLQVCARKISSEFDEKFNIGITRLVESGIPKKYLHNIKDLSKFCSEDSGTGVGQEPLRLESIQGVLVLWTGGITLAALVLACEIAHSRRHSSKKKSKQKRIEFTVKKFKGLDCRLVTDFQKSCQLKLTMTESITPNCQ